MISIFTTLFYSSTTKSIYFNNNTCIYSCYRTYGQWPAYWPAAIITAWPTVLVFVLLNKNKYKDINYL